MFSDPESNLKQFGLDLGMQVADLGAGTGFYSLPAAKIVGSKGRVFAVEVQKDLLSRLKNTASSENLTNIDVVWGDVEKIGGTRLRDSSIDRAIASNLLFQLDDKPGFAAEAARLLKQGGKLLLIDWSDSSSISGPGARFVTKNTAQEIFQAAGFEFEKEIQAGDHHYGLIFKKK